MTVGNEELWHSPIKAFSDYLQAAEEIGDDGVDKINRLDKYQKIRETRVLAVLCFAMFKRMGTPWYLQLDENEKTDGRVMRQSPSNKTDQELLRVEHTSYKLRNDGKLPDDTLLDQLKRTKALEHKHKYDESTLVLVELGTGFTKKTGVDFPAIAEYLKSIDAPYQLWAMEVVQASPDTIVRVSVCTPEFKQMDMNVGEAWQDQLDLNIRGTLVARHTDDATAAGVITPSSNPVTRPVWDFKG